MDIEEKRRYARIIAIVAGIVWLALFVVSFSERSTTLTFARWGALIVLGISWTYANAKPRT